MKHNVFSNELHSLLNNTDKNGAISAPNMSVKFYHSFCGTPHIFLALFRFLAQENANGNERYIPTYNTLREIVNRYGVNSKSFEAAFLQYFPAGEEPGPNDKFSIVPDQEFKIITQSLQRDALKFKRTMEIEDLIMALFYDPSYNLHIVLKDIVGSDNKHEEMLNEITKAFKKNVVVEIEELEECIELNNLNRWLSKNPQKIINAEEQVKKIEMALSGRSIRNAILTGPAGTGKTTYIYAFVQDILNGTAPEQFRDKIVYELDTTSLVAGTRYRGDLEEKIQNILQVVSKNPNVIIFVDEMHTLINLGAGGEDKSQSTGNMLKPYLTRGEIQIIGCTTAEEYTKTLLPDKAFCSRFHEIKIAEPGVEEVREILTGLLPVETEFFKREIQENLLDEVVKLSQKYSLEQANPRKAINMLELACAYSRVFEESNTEVDVSDIIESIKLRYNIYISEDKLKETEKALFETLLGQDEALKQVVRNLKIVDRNLVDLERPALSMLLAGSTGTGKTMSAKIIAKYFFGSENNIVHINCGEYSSKEDVKKLTGSSPSYIGYDDETALIKGVREKPNSVVLFDEIEKAHQEVQKVLLNILDTGTMNDNKGNTVSFRNTIIIFTTNLGCTKDTGKAKGMGFVKEKGSVFDKDEILKAIEEYFSPEFLGRLDDIVYYNSLTKDIARNLVLRYFKEYQKQCELGFELVESDIQKIIEASEIETRGARGIKKAVRKQIVKIEDGQED